jgi:hypothetical protein
VGAGSGSGEVPAGGAVVVSAGGMVVDGSAVDVVVGVIPAVVVLDDRDDRRASSDGEPALHAAVTRARLATSTPSFRTRRC